MIAIIGNADIVRCKTVSKLTYVVPRQLEQSAPVFL